MHLVCEAEEIMEKDNLPEGTEKEKNFEYTAKCVLTYLAYICGGITIWILVSKILDIFIK